MSDIVLATLLLAVCFGVGYVTRSHLGSLVLSCLFLVAAFGYVTRSQGQPPDETDVLPAAFLVISALALALYALGVNRGRKAGEPGTSRR